MMFADYLEAALNHATFEWLDDAGGYVGSIDGFQGVWANGPTVESCRAELAEVLEDWLLFRIASHLGLPEVDGMTLAIPGVA